MNLDQLWAPWRIGYIKDGQKSRAAGAAAQPAVGTNQSASATNCFLCRAAGDTAEDRANLVIHRTALSLVVLNRYPFMNGHLLVSPLRHAARLDDLTDDETCELARLLPAMTGLIEREMKPHGFNVGLNLGQVAGAGVPGHLHWHIVPRWPGDLNFMPVTAGVAVLPQALDDLWQFLTEALNRT